MSSTAPATLLHVTPAVNVPSVLVSGLLTAPPERNFACGSVIFLAEREADVHRWAAEIARQRGETTRFALLAVDTTGMMLVGSPAASTEIGVSQVTARFDIAADRITLVGEFDAEPAVNSHRDPAATVQPVAGIYECPDCGFQYTSATGLQSHVEDWCEGNDLGDD